MATWEEFCNGVKKFTKKVAVKTEELADLASLRIKLAQKKANLSELYEELGKLTYKQITDGGESADHAEEIIAKLDALTSEIAAMKAELEAKKAENKKES